MKKVLKYILDGSVLALFPEQLTDDNLDLKKFPKPSILGKIRRLAWLVLYWHVLYRIIRYIGLRYWMGFT